MTQFTIIQLTDNNVEDDRPFISGSNVVWEGDDGNDTEIFLYDGNNITQITNNDIDDEDPFISGNNIVWESNDGNDGKIYFYDGNEIIQVTDNDTEDANPDISGNNITWEANDGNDVEIFFATLNSSQTENTNTTVYRFFNNDTGVHFYTANETERDAVEDLANFSFEGEAFAAYATEVDGSIPIYRFFNDTTGAHFYTPSATERDNVENNLPEYQSEGIAYYALPVESEVV